MIQATNAITHFDEIIEINNGLDSIPSKYARLRILLEKITKEITVKEVAQFSNLFSRLSFICDKYKTARHIHSFRITANKVSSPNIIISEEEYLTHLKYYCQFVSSLYKVTVPAELRNLYPKDEFQSKKLLGKVTRLDFVRVEIKEIREYSLICNADTEEIEDNIEVRINQLNVNHEFNCIGDFWIGAQLFLINIDIDEYNIYYPKIIILEPDYLIDISAIAECFQDFGTSELNYIRSKFEEVVNTKYIRLGNFANLVVDEMFKSRTHGTFKETFEADFQAYPFEYTTCEDLKSDSKFREFWTDAEMQYNNIKRVIENDFQRINISLDSASLEPSFLCERYGIQGRLDILELNKKDEGISKIIELKSGSVPFPDNGRSIKPNHKVQLFLYYQIIGVVNKLNFKEINEKTDGYILYSKIIKNNIREDRPTLSHVQQIFNLRNKLIVNEYLLSSDDISKTRGIIEQITADKLINSPTIHPNFRQKIEPQFDKFLEPVNDADETEKSYFYSFISFIAKEQYLAKLGSGREDYSNGLANLWLKSFDEKADKGEILFDLTITFGDNSINQPAKEIIFTRPKKVNEFVNFRKGDICVLYPRKNNADIATSHQIFKCTIKEISKNRVIVVFRYQQRNLKYFERVDTWALERDFMDSSFSSMYRNIYSFLQAPKDKRNLLLTKTNPRKNINYGYSNKDLSEEQNRIINNALSAKDYFLLNGPPGTGKTSIIIKELVRELHRNEETNILLVAYTNRAVDELCESVNNAIINFDAINDGRVNFGRSDLNFIRIGGELSCDENHRHNLLSNVSKNVKSRKGLQELLSKHRIYISTVAALSSKMDIFKLKNFDVIIVDEASQILEPQIVGILPKCEKFILIGDHKQLPAIVLQTVEKSKTNNSLLASIGLENRKNSLFERLYTYCEKKNLSFAFDILTYQGRMHQEIALFPNYSFYNSVLKEAFYIPSLPLTEKKELERQVLDLELESSTKHTLEDLLCKKRLIYFQSVSDPEANQKEAALVAKIVDSVKQIYKRNNKEFKNHKTIGIIAPFRNQIALIKQKLEEAKIENYGDISVDTVERYQGSQRDIMIISFAIDSPFQLDRIVNLNDDGSVDRKLNVALTRAKEQIILIGNDAILSNNLIYFKLIEYIKSQGGYVSDPIDNLISDKIKFVYFDEDKSVEGIVHNSDSEFKSVFDHLIINTLKNDVRTTSYPKAILGVSNNFIRNNIIEYGRTKFDNEYQEFSMNDKVNLYCFYNMRKHYFSSYSIFHGFKEYFKIEIEQTSNRVAFFDIGCGPMTSGLAFNQSMKVDLPNLYFNYIGIDLSNAMIDKAELFSQSGLFNRNTQFYFENSIGQIGENILEESLRTPSTILFNFCYLFSNLTPQQATDLAIEVNSITKKYPLNKYIIIYQNPVNSYQNFAKFKKELLIFNRNIVQKSETVSYKNSFQDWYDKTEYFTYEILSN